MRAFNVTITETRQRKVQVAANDSGHAKAAVQAMLANGETIKLVEQIGQARTGEADAALRHLLEQEYLPLNGVVADVHEWLFQATTAAKRRDDSYIALNKGMAMAGLRASADGLRIIIASAGSIPTLALWFERTEWRGPDLISTLRTAPDALMHTYSFAGINSKAVSLPTDTVLGVAT